VVIWLSRQAHVQGNGYKRGKEIKMAENNKQFGTIPVEQDMEYDVEIAFVGSKGDGIAKIEGFTIFVPNTNVGDKVKVRIGRVLPQYAFAEVV